MCLTNHMPLGRELQRVATDHLGLYEIEQPRGARNLHRAVQAMDRVNADIFSQIRSLWDLHPDAPAATDRPSVLDDML